MFSSRRAIALLAASAAAVAYVATTDDEDDLQIDDPKDPRAKRIVAKFRASNAVAYAHPYVFHLVGDYLKGTVHTIVHAMLRRHVYAAPAPSYKPELIVLEDGGTVKLDWADDPETRALPADAPVVFFHHGLAGDSSATYIVHTLQRLRRTLGCRCVVLVARGCGDVPLTTPEGFTAARTADMGHALEKVVVDRYPNAEAYVGVGFSLGAGLLLKYVGESADACPLDGAVALSPPFDFHSTTDQFDMWSSLHLVNGLKKWYLKHKKQLLSVESVVHEEIMSARTVRDFDAASVVKIFGYEDVDDYYTDSSPMRYAHGITVPTLAVSAIDDPVCRYVPKERFQEHGGVGVGLTLASTRHGGHVAHGKGYFGEESHQDDVIVAWVEAVLSEKRERLGRGR